MPTTSSAEQYAPGCERGVSRYNRICERALAEGMWPLRNATGLGTCCRPIFKGGSLGSLHIISLGNCIRKLMSDVPLPCDTVGMPQLAEQLTDSS